jgi:serine-type D-Ala-D-Ala carboxypeptidase/endopeptidase (penicillin-binding protein 4)
VVMLGRGDARMSSALDCKVNCLAMLADAVAAKARTVGDVVGDDTWFPDQRWSPGMSWNNFGTEDATAASALSLDSNELTLRAVPGEVGRPPVLDVPSYVTVVNEATTVAAGKSRLTLEHTLNSRQFRLYGTLAVDTKEWRARIGMDDPAHFAAWTFARMLRARGVQVKGRVRAVHRPVSDIDDPDAPLQGQAVGPRRANTVHGPMLSGFTGNDLAPLATLTPPPLAEDVAIINKLSQNHHSELLLRRIARQHAAGSTGDGLKLARIVFERAGIPRAGYDFSDGSGMSTYNRVSPRAVVALLRWTATQPWGEAWYSSLPIAGVDGTLKRRFVGTPLAGNLAAKTGTLNATNALSGRFRAKSGRMLTFAFFANDVPDGASPLAAMEAALLLIAEAN